MKSAHYKLSLNIRLIALVVLITLLAGLGHSHALTTTGSTTTSGTSSASSASQTQLKLLINDGNTEINRRLTKLKSLGADINDALYLSSSDKTSLSSEVSTELSNLTTLQTKLDGETTPADAATDDASVITEYRVYALVAPKVNIIIAADNQQAAQASLSSLASGFTAALTKDQSAGKDVTTLQSDLSDLNTQLDNAKAISSQVETSVIGLQPSDYNSNHLTLTGYYNQLVTARYDNSKAISDAKEILSGLKSL